MLAVERRGKGCRVFMVCSSTVCPAWSCSRLHLERALSDEERCVGGQPVRWPARFCEMGGLPPRKGGAWNTGRAVACRDLSCSL